MADEDHAVTERDRHPLELYAQLTDDEFLYVQELQRVYDESRCYFVQWILGKEAKELVKSARISAIQQGRRFTWSHTRLEILKSLTDVTLTARFLALSRLKRKNGSTAKKLDIASPYPPSPSRRFQTPYPRYPTRGTLSRTYRWTDVGSRDYTFRVPVHRR